MPFQILLGGAKNTMMTDTHTASDRVGYSGTALKLTACITMLVDHIGASCIESTYTTLNRAPLMLATLDRTMRLIGRLAFPIYCFLLVEGFLHTHDVRRYFQRLLLFGLLSEIPFDLAFYRTPFYWDHQNVYWTLALGVLAMAALQKFQKEEGKVSWQGWLAALGCVIIAELAATDYGAIGVALILALYLTRKSRKQQCIVGAVMMLYELTAPLAFLLVWYYNGERGYCPKWMQRAFYLFYPVHLALLAAITNLLL